MCFSATASFVAAGALTAGSAVTLGSVRTRREIPLALIPLIFAFQQFVEGIQWLAEKPSPVSSAAAYVFMFIAVVFWPAYTPFAILCVEKNPKRKKIIRWFGGIGIIVAISTLVLLLSKPMTVLAIQKHIVYLIDLPITLGMLLYLIAMVGSGLASSYRFLRWFGAGILLSLFLSYVLAPQTFGSIWCFFAAALSVLLIFHFRTRS